MLLLSGSSLAYASTLDLTAANAVNGTINVPNTNGGPVLVKSNGKDSVTVWLPSNWSDPLTVNKDGSVTLTDQHATGQVTTIYNAPALYFSDGNGVYLPSLKPIGSTGGGGGNGGGGNGGGGSSGGGAIVAPVLPAAQGGAEIVAVELRNAAATASARGVVTFGQAFVRGDLPAGATLTAASAAGPIPVTMDVKARDADGSVRYAILSLQAPPMDAGTTLDVMLSRSTTPASGTVIQPADILASGYDVRLRLDFSQGGSVPAVGVSAAAALQAAIAAGTVETYLSNPLVAEYRVTKKINSRLLAIFDIRAATDGTIRTDVIVSNDYSYLAPESFTYNAMILSQGKKVWEADNINHYKFQMWHQTVWNSTATRPDVVFDIPYLVRSGAVPAFDTTLGVADATLDSYLQAVNAAASGPLGKALVTPYMPMTGGRDDIGIVPNWTADWIVTQDPRAMTVMMANADAAGSVPWHMRELDGSLVTSQNHPQLWMDDRCTGSDCMPGGFDSVTVPTGWTLDASHEPDLAYIPYLVTGTHYYLDQVQNEANWEVLGANPGYRDGTKGLVYPNDQIRGVAWNIRDISNAGWITPDTSPVKSYFQTRAAWNIQSIYNAMVVQKQGPDVGELTGFLYDPYHPNCISPWQQDFIVLSLTQQARRGNSYAHEFESWMINFVAGRFLNGANGFNPLNGPAYWPIYVNPHTNTPVQTWRDFYDLNFAGQPAPTALAGYPTSNGGYAAVARSSMADLFSTTRSIDALHAYAFLVAQTPNIYPSFQQDGQFYDINPVLPDGHVLQNDEIQYAPKSGTLVADHAHNLLVGGSGTTTLQGAPGISILYAGSGPTTLIAAPGIDYLFGGSKTTTIRGGSGTSYISVGSGTTTIELKAAVAAQETIENFKVGVDHIHVAGLGQPLRTVLDSARQAPDGATSIAIGPHHTITFTHLAAHGITAQMFD